jgi:acetyl esterase/lipase/cyclophilin family peptidyl-prolyl cis-trans isomerase
MTLGAEQPARSLTMAEVLGKSTSQDWRRLDPESTLYMDLASGRVIIELAPDFAPNHVANVKALVREKYFDGLSILRVQDNYVVQWGDPNGENPKAARKIQAARRTLSPEFDRELDTNLPFTALPDGDLYAPEVGWSKGFPVARDPKNGKMWLLHCYAMVGAGRDNPIDSGGGTELYAMIGHAPRHLDRNVTLLGRVVQGIELLSSLPRGTGALGFYEKPEQRIPIKSIRVAADLPENERTSLDLLRTDTPLFTDLIEARRNRREEWYHTQAGRIEIGNVPLPVRAAKAQPVVLEIWPGTPPDETPGKIGPERNRTSPKLDRTQVEVTNSTRLITAVTKPTISILKPPKEKDTGTAVLIFPGGGYWDLYWELEGEEVAEWLNSIGITGVILKYRVPRRPGEPEKEPASRPLQDAQRALSLLRSKSAEWGIQKIGVIGFSAGGHLAIASATEFENRKYAAMDDVDNQSCRPDFAIPVYSGYLKAKEADTLAAGLRVPANTPPVFLVHGNDDIISPPEGSTLMYLALKRAGVPAELHIYANTTHDFGVRQNDRSYAKWTEACAAWMRELGFIGK